MRSEGENDGGWKREVECNATPLIGGDQEGLMQYQDEPLFRGTSYGALHGRRLVYPPPHPFLPRRSSYI